MYVLQGFELTWIVNYELEGVEQERLLMALSLHHAPLLCILRKNTTNLTITWCFSDRASWIDYILITNLMHWLLFIHKILYSSTCFEPQVLIFRRIQMYTCSIWYCHSSWCPVGRHLCTDRTPRTLVESDNTICCKYTVLCSWRWALEARNM